MILPSSIEDILDMTHEELVEAYIEDGVDEELAKVFATILKRRFDPKAPVI